MLGTRFIGRYKVIEELGRGGMGIVYRGEDPRLERPVAIKVLPPRRTSSTKALERFKLEARVCARLDHPYILKIYDYGEEENTYHIVMEYVEGITLREVIGEDPQPTLIDIREMSRLFGQICQALEYAHSKKITHRDIKPENIMVTTEPGTWGSRNVKVMDFGLAVLEGRHDLTDQNAIMGTIAYFSPEQARGEGGDHRSDIYSLGVLFYEMLTGELPFDANNPSDMIRRHLETPPPSPRNVRSEISPILERIVLTCMRKDPADRYQSVRLVRDELESYRSEANISAALFWGSTGIVLGDDMRQSLSPSELEGTPPSTQSTDGRVGLHVPQEPARALLKNESTADDLKIPPLASPYTPGMPAEIANRLGPPRAITPISGLLPPIVSPPLGGPGELSPSPAFPGLAGARLGDVSSLPPAPPSSGLPGVASTEWVQQAKEVKGQWGKYQQVLSRLQRDEALTGSLGDETIPATVCGRCGIENPGDRKYCLECGSLLAPSQFQMHREAAAHNELGLRMMRQGNLQEALYEFQQALQREPDMAEAHKNLGKLWARLGELIKAEEELKQAASLTREDAEIYIELAALFRQTGRKDEAIGALQESLRIAPREATVRCQLAFLYSHRGDFGRAVEEYRIVLSHAPDTLEAHLQLGIIYGSQNMVPEAITEFEGVVRLDPHNQSAYQWLGRLYAKRNRFGEAERAYQSALQLNPVDAGIHTELGAIYEVQRKEELALRQLRQAISLDHGNLNARTRLAGLYLKHQQPGKAIQELEEVVTYHPKDAKLHQQLGELYLKQNQLDKALFHFEQTVSLDPTSADMHNKLGQVYLKKEYDTLSIQEYQKAITLDPANADFREHLGMAYYVNGQRDSAIQEIKKAAMLNSKNVDYFKALGILLTEDQRLEEAVQHFKRAIELAPRDADAHALLGRAHSKQGLLNYAILEFQKALELSPDNNLLMLIYLARSHAELGKPQEAIAYFKKAISMQTGKIETPENRLALARSYQDLGKAYLESGEVRKAQEVLESALNVVPEEPRTLHYLGLACQAQGNFPKALEYLTASLQRSPNDSDLLADLSTLYQEHGDNDLALKAIRKAILLSPARALYYELLSKMLASRHLYDEANEVLRKAANLEPKRADHYHWLRAEYLREQGLAQKAAGEYQQGMLVNPNNWRLYHGLARAFEELGRNQDALDELKKALSLQLNDSDSRVLVEELERLRAQMRQLAFVYADVVVSVPSRGLDRPFTYRIPDTMADKVRVGSMVRAPFNRKSLDGYVVGLHQEPPPGLAPESIRELQAVQDAAAFWGEDLLALAQWMHDFYAALMVDALHAIVPVPVRASLGKRPKKGDRGGRTRVVTLVAGAAGEAETLAALDGEMPQARRILQTLREAGAMPPMELLSTAHAGREVLSALKQAGLVGYRMVRPESLPRSDDPIRTEGTGPGTGDGSSEDAGSVAGADAGHAAGWSGAVPHELTEAQSHAVDRICTLAAAGRAAVVLLHGVTGSGKTEVYLRSLQEIVRRGKQGLVLVPEISLTPQAVDRYRSRLGEEVAVLHSALTPGERVQEWWRLKEGRMSVALGARSCVFAPLARPALFIVDEEHDSSYKQENSPRYHARQVAIRRAIHSGAVVVLGSATPALETYYWASQGRYELIELPCRVAGRPMPQVEIVDLRRRGALRPGRVNALGSVLKDRMRDVLARGEQVMLLMNRRGFSSYLMCKDCGAILRCPRCDISLTYHSAPPALLCHYCLYEKSPSSLCPSCHGPGLTYFGSGTQRVEEELLEAFKGVGIIRMDKDTTRRMGDHRRILERFSRKEAQILLGTQMIAKGHDFPNVTLVGVVLADMALNLPDFRSAEKTFSLLTQVAGRAGRGEEPGQVVIQTYNPEHAAVQCASRQDYLGFYQDELRCRKELSYPPFSHLVNLIFSGEDEETVAAAARQAAQSLAPSASAAAAEILGPAPCAVGRIHRKYRWHMTFKAPTVQEIMPAIRNYLGTKARPGVQVAVDADPVSML